MSSDLSAGERMAYFYAGTARILIPLDFAIILWMTYLFHATDAVRDTGALARAPNPVWVRLPSLVLAVTALWILLAPLAIIIYDNLSGGKVREFLADVRRWCWGYVWNTYRNLRAGVTGRDAE